MIAALPGTNRPMKLTMADSAAEKPMRACCGPIWRPAGRNGRMAALCRPVPSWGPVDSLADRRSTRAYKKARELQMEFGLNDDVPWSAARAEKRSKADEAQTQLNRQPPRGRKRMRRHAPKGPSAGSASATDWLQRT